MKKLKYKALSIAVALSLGTLVGCGSDDGDDKVSVKSTLKFDQQVSGTAVKGAMRDAVITVWMADDKGVLTQIPYQAASGDVEGTFSVNKGTNQAADAKSAHMTDLVKKNNESPVLTGADGSYSLFLKDDLEGTVVVQFETTEDKGLIRCDSLVEEGCGSGEGGADADDKIDDLKDSKDVAVNPTATVNNKVEFGEWYRDAVKLKTLFIASKPAASRVDGLDANVSLKPGPYKANCSVYTEMATSDLLGKEKKIESADIKASGRAIIQQLFSNLLLDTDTAGDKILQQMLDNLMNAPVLDLAGMEETDGEVSASFLKIAMLSSSLQAAATLESDKTLQEIINDLNDNVANGKINDADNAVLELINTHLATTQKGLEDALADGAAGYLDAINAIFVKALEQIQNLTLDDVKDGTTKANSLNVGCDKSASNNACDNTADGLANLFDPLKTKTQSDLAKTDENREKLLVAKVVNDNGTPDNTDDDSVTSVGGYIIQLEDAVTDMNETEDNGKKVQKARTLKQNFFKKATTLNSYEPDTQVDPDHQIDIEKLVSQLKNEAADTLVKSEILLAAIPEAEGVSQINTDAKKLVTDVDASVKRVTDALTAIDALANDSAGIGDGDQLDSTIALVNASEANNTAVSTMNTAASTAITETETLSSGITTLAAAITFDQKATAVKTEVDKAVTDAAEAVSAANTAKNAADALLAANPGNSLATSLVADADAAVTAANSADTTAKNNQTTLDALLTQARAEVSEEQTKILNNTKLLSQGALLESKSVTDQMVDVFREAANAGSTNGAYADSTTVSGWEYKYDGAFNMEMRDKANADIRKLHMVGEISGTTSRAGLATTQVNFAFSATLNPPVASGVKFMVKNENDLSTAAGVTAALAECKTAMDAVIADPTKMIADTDKPKGSCAVVIYDGTITNASGIGQSAQVKNANFTRFDYADRADTTATKMVDDAVVQHLGQNNSEAYVSAMGKITDKSDSSNEMSATLMMDGWYKKDVTLSSGAEGDIDKGTITIMDVDSTTEGDQTFVADYMMEEGTSRTVTGTVKYRDTSVGTFAESTTTGNLEISFSSISQTLVMAMDVFTTR